MSEIFYNIVRRVRRDTMREIEVEGDNRYKIYIDTNLDKLYKAFEDYKIKSNSEMFLITDDKVYSIYKDRIEMLKNIYNIKEFYFKNGEENKTLETLQEIYSFLMENNAKRNSIIIALGGGVVGDLVGFVASTYMRGVRYINIPTTLLSQIDSCVGGKVGYNYKGIKNLIGSFYNPEFVFISTNFLKTLDFQRFKDGLGEVIKYGLILDEEIISFIEENYKGVLEKESDKLLYITRTCLILKKQVIEMDYKDLGFRNILNFGHTIGHAIEMTSKNKITHGEAVALGMLVSLKLSEHIYGLDKNLYYRMEKLYKKLGLPTKYKVDNYNLFMYAINHDKKNKDNIRFVLLKDVEKPEVKIEVNKEEILKAIEESIN
ncbi:3-dehydroquinate synthase [Clostridium tetani]|uniref:3-dehydroquinate synthase n=2 Tax=Clostridium tetani TaxID=1513 RepID=AROB_CLOTE|nr:RecName: Full=3-dehydroquinate synthase; Short=DHQS [Clostridium tetani E88]RXI45979.1 3-dehydroquinate synthase [Clostridium tetani]AAO36163.1 3-dehydroquinate synthase [Clostridium tetani E88]RXI62035.1 3-dehydroquinate synthase [Clostridium tetani]RXI64079.1 3-dehydroquinate synthase [Clostridium tetani]RXI65731.1 3-dehydroquinate synthase [Clostridium tetani]